MKWAYSIRQKMTVAILFAVVLGFVMLGNLSERYRLKKLDKSFASIFEDRLVAESYIFRISELLHQKADAMEKQMLGKPSGDYLKMDDSINVLMQQYRNTQFTKEEEGLFAGFTTSVSELDEFQKRHSKAVGTARYGQQYDDSLKALMKASLDKLASLSALQVAEGKKINMESRDVLTTNTTVSDLEMIILIVIAVIIQVLVFASRSISGSLVQKPHLN